MTYSLQVFNEGSWRTLALVQPQPVLQMQEGEVLAFLLAATQAALDPTIAPQNVRIVEAPPFKGPRWQS